MVEELEEKLVEIDKSKLYKVFILNDEWNTFDWVIKCLIKICGHTNEQAEQCALLAHYKGECEVKVSTLNKVKDISKKLENAGINSRIE